MMPAANAVEALDAMIRYLDLRNRLPSRVLSIEPKYLVFFRGDLISDENLMDDLLCAVQSGAMLEAAMGVYSVSSRDACWLIPSCIKERTASLSSLRLQYISAWPLYCNDHCVLADLSENWLIYFDPIEDFGCVALYGTGDSIPIRVNRLRDCGCFSLDDIENHLCGAEIHIQLCGLQNEFLEKLKESY